MRQNEFKLINIYSLNSNMPLFFNKEFYNIPILQVVGCIEKILKRIFNCIESTQVGLFDGTKNEAI